MSNSNEWDPNQHPNPQEIPEPLSRNRVDNFKIEFSDDFFSDSPIEAEYPEQAEGDVFPQVDSKVTSGKEPDILSSFSEGYVPRKAAAAEQRPADKEAIKAEKKRKKQVGKKNGCLFKMIWGVMVLLVSAVLAQYLLTGINDMLAVNRNGSKENVQQVFVTIPASATTAQVADILVKNGIISRADFFSLFSKITKNDNAYKEGTYKLDATMDYEAIISSLQSSSNRQWVEVQITEGKNVQEIADLLEKSNVCKAKDFLKAANSSDFDANYDFLKAITNADKRYYKLEGYLFPDTYRFYLNDDPKDVIKKFLANYRDKMKVNITDEVQKKIDAKKMSMDQILTVASLIQAEASDSADMLKVSSVIYNRLQFGKKHNIYTLDMDSTVWYPYRKKADVPADIVNTFKSNYDTTTIQGLPPGPICNPGVEAINAAINEVDTNYFYFCHDTKTGQPYYATTPAEHDANLKKAGLK